MPFSLHALGPILMTQPSSAPAPAPAPSPSPLLNDQYWIVEDPFVLHHRIVGAEQGPLAGLRLAVKDLFDVEGLPTACGTLDWPTRDKPAKRTAPTVQVLLDAGADIVGKTITDELACSLVGTNLHYGTPRNPMTPDRVPGGSSSGSAVAVAGGLADLGLGTDTGGSIRVPCLYNNLFGLRPSHGRISVEGCMELCAPFDTVGLMARDAETLATGMAVLLDQEVPPGALPEAEIFLASALFEGLESRMTDLAGEAIRYFGALAPLPGLTFADVPALSEACYNAYGVLQGRPIWEAHGAWIERDSPRLAPEIEARFRLGGTRSGEDERKHRAVAEASLRPLSTVLERGGFIVLPTGPTAAPSFAMMQDAGALQEREAVRRQLLGLTAMAPILGVPQIHVPMPNTDGIPRGLSVMGPRGSDLALLGLVRAWSERLA